HRPVRRLSAGGIAEVFVTPPARDDGGTEMIAIKRIRPHLRGVAEACELFTHEATLLGALAHPGIVRALDVSAAAREGWFTLELVHGRGLVEVVRRAERVGVRMPLRHAIGIVAATAEALEHAHVQPGPDRKPLEVVHCDVSPANLMLAYDGSVKLVDFGAAQSRLRRANSRALPNAGTLAYMSPEQSRGEAVDRRSDVYALGVLLWELATWSRLYRRLGPEQIIARVAVGAVPLPSQLRADIPSELEDVIMIAVQPTRERRFANAGELARALRRLSGAEDRRGLDAWLRRVFH
ncbi:MAG: serine/threonine protein kinase, partial [Deltaproteobacteria bacterium]|nr:serine/threonine protein kinase [Nannocystaceae bacterium]